MKKVKVFLFSLCSVFLFFSCSGNVNTPNVDLKTEKDSLAYAIGVANAEGVAGRLVQSRIDSTYMEYYLQGILDAATEKADTQKIAYFLGIQVGQQFNKEFFNQFNSYYFKNDSSKYLDKDVFMSGLLAGMQNKNLKMSLQEAPAYAEGKLDSINAIAMEEEFGENKAAGIKFLEENKVKPGVVTLENGVQYKIIKEGKGEKPTLQDRVKVHYRGTLIDGTKFDASFDENVKKEKEPRTFGVTDVIPGWTEILLLMPVGSKWEVYIPQEMAYSSQDRGIIKPFSTLIFEMELVGIEKPAAVPADAIPVQPQQ